MSGLEEPAPARQGQPVLPTEDPRLRIRVRVLALVASVAVVIAVVFFGGWHGAHRPATATSSAAPSRVAAAPTPPPGNNIYAAAGANMLAPAVAAMPDRVYVPQSAGRGIYVIDPATLKVIDRYPTGLDPQHVVPAWDLKTLYVTNDLANNLTPVDPFTSKPAGPNIAVADPYNLYFTPDGTTAIVVAEAQSRLDFRDPHSFVLLKTLPVGCPGVDHIDFSADGSYLVATCEFSAQLVKVDLRSRAVVGYLKLAGSSPQDIKLDPAGRIFYVADRNRGGVHQIDAATFREIGFLPTGKDTHGLYPSRDARFLYVTNRGSGSVTVIDFATGRPVAVWHIPGGRSPDMGGVSADGAVLWLSGRYDGAVYAISTQDGHLIARVPVPGEPHGLCVWPQPGRFSLGHTGVMR
ncbi:MAG TPA: YncE family protein [Actinomycetota bacterium]|nr:YncE family protein [Actinomycetota bacterium]